MRNKKKRNLCILAAAGASVLMNIPAMASEQTIALPYMREDAWEQIAMTNDDAITTGVNIRSAASEDSEIIGCMYYGGAAWVLEKGEEWTELYSGGVTGFVKNEYLVYGEDARGLADAYGIEGVTTTWDDVPLYSKPDSNASSIIRSLDTGSSYILTEDRGHWLEVQNGADSTAYVSSEDVTPVLLLNTAVPMDEQTSSAGMTQPAADYYAEETQPATDYYVEETQPATDYYVEETQPATDYYVEETQPATDYYVEETQPTTEASGDGSYYDPETGISYDASTGLYYDSGTGTYYDAWWNPVNPDGSSQTEPIQTEAPETNAPETEAPVQTNSDDVTLLGALIYCEAGNQSYEGMVAVGAVVMNRVYSPSFPNTIYDVIYQSGQFTPAYSGALSSALANGVPSVCYTAAAAAISGENPVGGALYFNTGSGKGFKIGDHQFY